MELLLRACEYLRDVGEFDSQPDLESVGISTEEYSDEVDYEIKGRFPEEQEDEGRVIPPSERVLVSRDSRMHTLIEEVFCYVEDNVQVSGAEIESIHIGSTVEPSEMFEGSPTYTSDVADARVFIGVSREEMPMDVRDELMGLLLDAVHTLDGSVSASDVRNVEFLFDDVKRNFNHCVRGELFTEHPYRYYSNVSSLEEYIDKAASDGDERDALEGQSEYKVSFIEGMFVDSEEMGDGQNIVPPVWMREGAEDIMDEFIDETLETDWEVLIEAEGLSFGEFEFDDLGKMKYWVNVPIVDGEFGVVRDS